MCHKIEMLQTHSFQGQNQLAVTAWRVRCGENLKILVFNLFIALNTVYLHIKDIPIFFATQRYHLGLRKLFLTRGKMWSVSFLHFFFEKNISNGFEVQDCIPGVQTLLQTPISGYNMHFGCYGHNGHHALQTHIKYFLSKKKMKETDRQHFPPCKNCNYPLNKSLACEQQDKCENSENFGKVGHPNPQSVEYLN